MSNLLYNKSILTPEDLLMNSLFDSIGSTINSLATFCKIVFWAVCTLMHISTAVVVVFVASIGFNTMLHENNILELITGFWMFFFVVVFFVPHLLKVLEGNLGLAGKIAAGFLVGFPVGWWLFLPLVLPAPNMFLYMFPLAIGVLLVGLLVPLKSKPGS